ncbi:MAG TPA: RNA polymerase sigma-70 factor [Bacteroidales bacterium]|nr:RNA polymerase sigma-70 factor [Bacteroidales bacterium]
MKLDQEDDLLLKIKEGDLIAFEELYFNMQPRLYAFSRKFIDDSEMSRDIIQEIFFEFWVNRKTLLINSSLNAYLFRTLHNKCLNHIRSQKVHERYSSYVDIKLKEAELLYFDQDQEGYKSIFLKEIQEIVNTSMQSLPESCREIFLMSRLEGLSNKEIAEKLHLSTRTVENQIYRALKILKVNLKDYLLAFPFLIIRLLY